MKEKDYEMLITDIKELLGKVCKDDRVRYHIEPVVKFACEMAKEMKADMQVVEISAYLHDITKMIGNKEEHYLTGAKFAENFLDNYDIEREKVKKIKECIMKHSGKSN